MKEARCFPVKQLVNGEWVDFVGEEVGKIGDGIAVTSHKILLDLEDGRLVNELTGDVFDRTKKDIDSGKNKNFFNKEKRILVTVYERSEPGDDWVKG